MALIAKGNLAYNKIAEKEGREIQELMQRSMQQDRGARSDEERKKLERITQAMGIFHKERGEWGLGAADGKALLKVIATEDVFNTMLLASGDLAGRKELVGMKLEGLL